MNIKLKIKSNEMKLIPVPVPVAGYGSIIQPRIGLMKLFLAFFTKALKSITDGLTDGRTDGRTDTCSYRDARTHIKRRKSVNLPSGGN